MRRISRLSRPIDRALTSPARPLPSSSQCTTACHHSITSFSTTTRATAAAPKQTSEFTERIRSKIWGTDDAPGREDPYSHDSPLRAPRRPVEQQLQQQQKKETPKRPAAAAGGPVRKQDAGDEDGYEPAKTWDGLEWVGGEDGGLGDGKEFRFVPAVAAKKVTETAEVTAAVRRALVEVVGAGEAAAQDDDVAWKAISLRDPAVKFAVVKRVMQLTGMRISDPVIAESNTAGLLLLKITKREQPKKLAERLEQNHTLSKLSNVKVSGTRVTPIDRERQVGRWKVIEQKLLDKNLPVTGHNI